MLTATSRFTHPPPPPSRSPQPPSLPSLVSVWWTECAVLRTRERERDRERETHTHTQSLWGWGSCATYVCTLKIPRQSEVGWWWWGMTGGGGGGGESSWPHFVEIPPAERISINLVWVTVEIVEDAVSLSRPQYPVSPSFLLPLPPPPPHHPSLPSLPHSFPYSPPPPVPQTSIITTPTPHLQGVYTHTASFMPLVAAACTYTHTL